MPTPWVSSSVDSEVEMFYEMVMAHEFEIFGWNLWIKSLDNRNCSFYFDDEESRFEAYETQIEN